MTTEAPVGEHSVDPPAPPRSSRSKSVKTSLPKREVAQDAFNYGNEIESHDGGCLTSCASGLNIFLKWCDNLMTSDCLPMEGDEPAPPQNTTKSKSTTTKGQRKLETFEDEKLAPNKKPDFLAVQSIGFPLFTWRHFVRTYSNNEASKVSLETIAPRKVFQFTSIFQEHFFGRMYTAKVKQSKGLNCISARLWIKVHSKKNEAAIRSIKNELTCMLVAADRPFFLHVLDHFQTPYGFYIVAAAEGECTLEDVIEQAPEVTIEMIRVFVAEISLAIAYLHDSKIIHRLSATNIMLDSKGHILLTNFAYVFFGTVTEGRCLGADVHYIAPEMIKGAGYGKCVDWWALGVILYYLMYAKLPYDGASSVAIIRQIIETVPVFKTTAQDKKFPSAMISFCKSLLDKNKGQRLGNGFNGNTDVSRHDVFHQVNWNKIVNKGFKGPFLPSSLESVRDKSSLDDISVCMARSDISLAEWQEVEFNISNEADPAPRQSKRANSIYFGNALVSREARKSIAPISPHHPARSHSISPRSSSRQSTVGLQSLNRLSHDSKAFSKFLAMTDFSKDSTGRMTLTPRKSSTPNPKHDSPLGRMGHKPPSFDARSRITWEMSASAKEQSHSISAKLMGGPTQAESMASQAGEDIVTLRPANLTLSIPDSLSPWQPEQKDEPEIGKEIEQTDDDWYKNNSNHCNSNNNYNNDNNKDECNSNSSSDNKDDSDRDVCSTGSGGDGDKEDGHNNNSDDDGKDENNAPKEDTMADTDDDDDGEYMEDSNGSVIQNARRKEYLPAATDSEKSSHVTLCKTEAQTPSASVHEGLSLSDTECVIKRQAMDLSHVTDMAIGMINSDSSAGLNHIFMSIHLDQIQPTTCEKGARTTEERSSALCQLSKCIPRSRQTPSADKPADAAAEHRDDINTYQVETVPLHVATLATRTVSSPESCSISEVINDKDQNYADGERENKSTHLISSIPRLKRQNEGLDESCGSKTEESAWMEGGAGDLEANTSCSINDDRHRNIAGLREPQERSVVYSKKAASGVVKSCMATDPGAEDSVSVYRLIFPTRHVGNSTPFVTDEASSCQLGQAISGEISSEQQTGEEEVVVNINPIAQSVFSQLASEGRGPKQTLTEPKPQKRFVFFRLMTGELETSGSGGDSDDISDSIKFTDEYDYTETDDQDLEVCIKVGKVPIRNPRRKSRRNLTALIESKPWSFKVSLPVFHTVNAVNMSVSRDVYKEQYGKKHKKSLRKGKPIEIQSHEHKKKMGPHGYQFDDTGSMLPLVSQQSIKYGHDGEAIGNSNPLSAEEDDSCLLAMQQLDTNNWPGSYDLPNRPRSVTCGKADRGSYEILELGKGTDLLVCDQRKSNVSHTLTEIASRKMKQLLHLNLDTEPKPDTDVPGKASRSEDVTETLAIFEIDAFSKMEYMTPCVSRKVNNIQPRPRDHEVEQAECTAAFETRASSTQPPSVNDTDTRWNQTRGVRCTREDKGPPVPKSAVKKVSRLEQDNDDNSYTHERIKRASLRRHQLMHEMDEIIPCADTGPATRYMGRGYSQWSRIDDCEVRTHRQSTLFDPQIENQVDGNNVVGTLTIECFNPPVQGLILLQ